MDSNQKTRFAEINRRRVLAAISGASVLPWVGAQVANASQVVNVAGRQRMLLARMTKTYCEVGRGIDPAGSQLLLNESVAQFDLALSQLRVSAPTAEIKDTFSKLSAKWNDYKDLVVGSVIVKERVKLVFEGAEDLLVLANQATLQLEQTTGRAASKLTNVSGRQRMLTQQIAAYGFARNWAFTAAQTQPLIAKRQQEYLQALGFLQAAKENTNDIKRQLSEIGNMWVFFEVALAGTQNERPKALADMAVASELILKGYEELTGLYARLA
jgi:Type IV pili methyl-accepting chemotaxis transducer N-term